METNPETLVEFPSTQLHLRTPAMVEQSLMFTTTESEQKTCQLWKSGIFWLELWKDSKLQTPLPSRMRPHF